MSLACENLKKGKGVSEIKGGHWIYEVSKTEDSPGAKGLEFLIQAKTKNCITNFKTFKQSPQNESKPTRFSYSDKCLCTNI